MLTVNSGHHPTRGPIRRFIKISRSGRDRAHSLHLCNGLELGYISHHSIRYDPYRSPAADIPCTRIMKDDMIKGDLAMFTLRINPDTQRLKNRLIDKHYFR